MLKTLFSLCLSICFLTLSDAQTVSSDSLSDTLSSENSTHVGTKGNAEDLLQATVISIPFIAGAAIQHNSYKDRRALQNDFAGDSGFSMGNYLQYIPATVMLGMKTGGVPSRSSWEKMILSDIIATAIMAGTVKGLKHTTDETRPDGSDNKSFPSGHTATAFMTASMLSKEYGHISPWINVGAYTIASTTGLMRIRQNRHWLPDVIAGASIGLISTELAYCLTDFIIKKNNTPFSGNDDDDTSDRRPTFAGLYTGYAIPLNKYRIPEDIDYQTYRSIATGVEGAFYFNRHIGIGGKATLSTIQMVTNDKTANPVNTDYYSFAAGPYFSIPINSQFSISTKLTADYILQNETTLPTTVIPKNNGFGFGTGLSIRRFHRRSVYGLFADFDVIPGHSLNKKQYSHTATIGTNVAISF